MSQLNRTSRYNVYLNRGTEGRGTAILTKGLTSTNILRLPTGRGMAAEINRTWIINIYMHLRVLKNGRRENAFLLMMFLF
jgi:hypothetical protein